MAQKRKRKRKPAQLHNLVRRPDEPGGVYSVDFYRGGRRVRQSLETSVLKIAKQRRDAILADKDRAKWGHEAADIAVDEFWQRYEEHAAPRIAPVTLSTYRTHWGQFTEFAKPATLGGVTPDDVERFIRYRKGQGRTNRTINDSLTALKTLYRTAAEMGVYTGRNPLERTKRLKVVKNPPKYLDKAQIESVLTTARAHSDRIYLFCSLAVYAGLRTAEAVNACWKWFDFEQGTLTVQAAPDGTWTPKSGAYRTVPLHSRLAEILEPYRQDDGYVINPQNKEPGTWRIRYEPKRAFTAVVNAAGVPWCTPHMLRHTFASQLVMAGVSIYKVSKWLGHADVTTTQIYAHLAPVDEDINRF